MTIDGRCTALTSLSDFVTNLESSGWFKRPVEIVDSQVERAAGADSGPDPLHREGPVRATRGLRRVQLRKAWTPVAPIRH